MAIFKVWPVKSDFGATIKYVENEKKTDINLVENKSLEETLKYATNSDKTENQYFVTGINCNYMVAKDDFISTKRQFNKEDGIQAYHAVLSFPEKEVTPDQCKDIGEEFAKRVWGKDYQVVMAVHLNTDNLHCHFVINSVSFTHGRRLQFGSTWFKVNKIVDEICKEHSLSTIAKPERNRDSYYLTKLNEKDNNTLYNNVKKDIDEAISMSRNMAEFKRILDEMGYSYNLSSNRKYWTIIPKGNRKPIRLYRLGDDYTNQRIMERLMDNPVEVRDKQTLFYDFNRKNYSFSNRGNRIKTKGSLKGLYLYYCYLLGYIPKYRRKKYNYRLHYLLKDDLIKVDTISECNRLLAKYSIDTSEQLFYYRDIISDQLNLLEKERQLLYGKDKNDITIQRKLIAINDVIKEKRHELKLIDDIAERSEVIEEKVRIIDEEEKQIKEKVKEER